MLMYICRISGIFCSRLYITPRHPDKTRKCQHQTGNFFTCR